jgi:hypothetical protein
MNLFPYTMAPFRPSVKYMLLCTWPWLFLYVASIPCMFLINPLFIIVTVLMLLAFFYHFALLAAELYIITPDMFMVSVGLINKTVSWFEPLKVRKIKIHQTRLMRYFNVSCLRISSNDELDISFTFKGVDVNTFIDSLRLNIDILEARCAYTDLLSKMVALADVLTKEHVKNSN